MRLSNQNGRAYFLVAQSDNGGGFITLIETNDGQIDPMTDLILPPTGLRGESGRYVWIDGYPSNGNNPIGSWNHPGKMELIGDILVVTAQNWETDCPTGSGIGSSQDALLFYNVSNPRNPVYMGKMDSSDLLATNAGNPPAELSAMAAVRRPDGAYILNVGGKHGYSTWISSVFSPNIADWTQLPTGTGYVFAGQHGMVYNAVVDGTEQVLSYDADGSQDYIYFRPYQFGPDATPLREGYGPNTRQPSTGDVWGFNVNLIGADRHWDSDSIYITEFGAPVIYSMESDFGANGVIFQIHNVRNIRASAPPGTDLFMLDRRVALRADNGQYVSAENGGGESISVDRAEIGPWETFTFVPVGGNRVAIRTWNGHYLVAENGGGQALLADRRELGPWETFTVTYLGNGRIALQADNGGFVVAENSGWDGLYANRGEIGAWETFTLVPQ